MAALSPLLLALVVVAPPSSDTRSIARWQPLIEEASARFGVPARWIERVLALESGGATTIGGMPIRSRAGAIGLMQLMPATWASIRQELHLGASPDDPHDNIIAGTFYLRRMYDRFGYPGLFAAYNAGPGRFADHLATRVALPSETRAYLVKLTREEPPYGPIAQPVVDSSLFAIAPGEVQNRSSDLFALPTSPAGGGR